MVLLLGGTIFFSSCEKEVKRSPNYVPYKDPIQESTYVPNKGPNGKKIKNAFRDGRTKLFLYFEDGTLMNISCYKYELKISNTRINGRTIKSFSKSKTDLLLRFTDGTSSKISCYKYELKVWYPH